MQLSCKIKIICTVWSATFLAFGCRSAAQSLRVVKKYKTYYRQVQADSSLKMVELRSLMPQIIYDLRYATPDNFTGQQLYRKGSSTFLRKEAAYALKEVEQDLHALGYGLRIFDAYRPYRATKKMWDLIHDERYVADPAKGSGHNRGLSVDLTLYNLQTGRMLEMGTGFDHFSDTAHHAFTALPDSVLQHRKLLRQAMEKRGFRTLETEWWHYSWPNNRNYDVLDIDFRKLRSYGE